MKANAATASGGTSRWERAGVVVPVVLVLGLALGVLEIVLWPAHGSGGGGGMGPGPAGPPPQVVETFAIFSAVNLALLAALVVVYLRTFLDTRANFALGLVAFLVVLLFEAVAGSPFLFALFGYGPGDLGPFLLLGSILESVALVIFLVLSLE
jgi:hypothetical protein